MELHEVLASLISEAETIVTLAESERLSLGHSEESSWIEFRQRYEEWYRKCIALFETNDFSGESDFVDLYIVDHPDLPSIRTALLIGFSYQNYYGFRDRFENQAAILQSYTESEKHSLIHPGRKDPSIIMYIDQDRINELKSISSSSYDLSKLIRICQELNMCYENKCHFAVAMLTRTILDHVPPLFGFRRFSQIANNYAAGGKSFKESMLHLENSTRKIADAHLHGQIRRSEVLPNKTQVNFSSDLDVLLAEIVRVLQEAAHNPTLS